MAIIRQKRKDRFSIIDNRIIENKKISFKARGLLIYMLAKPDDWKFYPDELAKHSDKDGVKAINTALQEIESVGYLVRKRKRDNKGHFKGIDYLLYETPQVINPDSQNRNADLRNSENGTLPNTDFKPNTDIPNTELDDDDKVTSSAEQKKPIEKDPFTLANQANINVNSELNMPIFVDYIQKLGNLVVCWAIHKTNENASHPNWQYLLTVMKNLETNHVRTVEQAEKLSEQYKQERATKKQQVSSNYRKRPPIREKMPEWSKKDQKELNKKASPEDIAKLKARIANRKKVNN
ncbi:DnaD domain protein [Limosilactobacillus reuteri]|uniref:DnaD domain protein n=1 Tax=Limosilactobacillus reuteri TaxID=1598 RepID=UPI001E349F45|nr:DnaD domain protein [Limosilactobacillus reuteri]MCC4383746.1 DnaD domain protein [Limosilactobacillus reuteri]MCC4420934.1 DnaD domain protein [Limosilactobacillus reuteri]